MDPVVVVGAGGLAREFCGFFVGQVQVLAHMVSDPETVQGLAHPIFSMEVRPDQVGTNRAVLAIGSGAHRERLHARLVENGFHFPTMIHDSAVVCDGDFGDGVVIGPNTTLGPNVRLGRFAYVNFMVGIGHDTEIGDYVQINPGVQIGGNCTIGQRSLLGSGATIRQGLSIGEDVTVSSGAVVLGRVRSGRTVLGNPAKKFSFG